MALEIKSEDIPEIFRQMVRHETEQVHRRVTWLGMFQGFLFTALCFAWEKSFALICLLSLIGMFTAICVFCGLICATWALNRLHDDWKKLRPTDYKGPEIFGYYPEKHAYSTYFSPENWLPLIFFLAWIIVVLVKLTMIFLGS